MILESLPEYTIINPWPVLIYWSTISLYSSCPAESLKIYLWKIFNDFSYLPKTLITPSSPSTVNSAL